MNVAPGAPPARIAVFGLGYVGCVTAACLAHLGHDVVGIDRDPYKVEQIQKGEAPFFEPGLPEVLRAAVDAGRLRATTETSEGLPGADVALLCVGTPSERSGNIGLGQLHKVCQDIAALQPSGMIVAVRSTVFPGTCEEIVIPALAGLRDVAVVANPEFLREGQAMKDFLEPALLVVGGEDRAAVERVAGLYANLQVDASLTALRTAEMIKYACNAYHAVKIDFANEIGTLCAHMGIEPHEVMSTLCRDHKLNTSAAYLKPGFAFGGSCLPKDLRALQFRASRLNLKLPLLEAALPSNQEHLRRAIEMVLQLPPGRLGIFGLAFKENTDDLRESPVVTLVEQLIGKGRELRIFDPHIQLDQIYGTNKNFILNAIPHISRLMCATVDELLDCEQLVVVQKPAREFATKLAGRPVLDLATTVAALLN